MLNIDPALLANPAEGFTVDQTDDRLIIHHKRVRTGCANAASITLLAGWTVGCVLMFSSPGREPAPLWMLIAFSLAELAIACVVLIMVFARTTFTLTKDNMTIEIGVLGLKHLRNVPRSSIEHLRQSQDSEGGLSRSYGLNLYAGKMIAVVWGQPHEISLWLGRVISQWADVWFGEYKLDR